MLSILSVLGGITIAVYSAATAGTVPPNTKTTTYIVHTGDTEWAVAARFDQRDDTRAVVDWIEQHNGLQGQAIQPGQTLVVPSDK